MQRIAPVIAGQTGESGHDFGDVGLVAGAGVLNQFAQPVGGAQQNADPVRRGNQLTGADQRQHVFHLVRQFADLHQFENSPLLL